MALLLSRFFILLSFIVLFGGCSAIVGYGDSLNSFDKNLASGKCDYSFVDEKIKDKDDVILWASQGGSLSRNCFDYERSNKLFDEAEKLYKIDVDLQSGAGKVGNHTSSILINNNVNEYKGNVYEKVMLNTYKGLNFMELGDFVNARIEFNRALDRQRRAKEYFAKEIQNKKESQSGNKNFGVSQNRNTQKALYDNYQDIFSKLEAYPDFINPYTTYMSGLFFLFDGDYAKARDILKTSISMDPKNQQIKDDFELADSLYGSISGKREKHYAWVIYENGKSMIKEELLINLPLFIFTNKVYYAGLALPKLYERESSYRYITINGQKTELIANMDSVIKAEFKKRFPTIATEAILNLIVKTYAQYELNKSSELAGVLGMIYQIATNKTDIRSWRALPKSFYSTRVELKENIVIIKDDNGKVISTVDVEKDRDVLIYVKSSSRGSVKVHKIIKGKR